MKSGRQLCFLQLFTIFFGEDFRRLTAACIISRIPAEHLVVLSRLLHQGSIVLNGHLWHQAGHTRAILLGKEELAVLRIQVEVLDSRIITRLFRLLFKRNLRGTNLQSKFFHLDRSSRVCGTFMMV